MLRTRARVNRVKILVLTFVTLMVGAATFFAQAPLTPETLPTRQLLSEAGPTFQVADNPQGRPLTVITYGDQRFTEPANVDDTDPRVRQYLVEQIARERPGAVVLNGDVPLTGTSALDYGVFLRESQAWRDAHLRIFPALGNHEFRGDPQAALERWWITFPELRNRRWYSAQLGARVYVLMLDSAASLLPGGYQQFWVEQQLGSLPASVDFVIVSIHHPPVADVQAHLYADHNPRPNEIALRDYFSRVAPKLHARILVSAGHIHNYERAERDGVTYLVSGGGGARPYFVERTPEDQYKSNLFPNYHYVKMTVEKDRLRGEMYRVENPEAAALSVELKDKFDLTVKP